MAQTVFAEMYREFSIGCTLNHPGIVNYRYFIRQTNAKSKEEEFHTFIELMEGGNLEEYLADMPYKREVSIQKVRDITRQIAKTLGYLHSQNIVH